MRWTRTALQLAFAVFLGCTQVETAAPSDEASPRSDAPAWHALYEGFDTDDYLDFVGVGLVDPEWAEHVTDMLHEHEIPNIVEGSVAYGISVAPGFEQRALTVLREDVATHGYWAELDGSP